MAQEFYGLYFQVPLLQWKKNEGEENNKTICLFWLNFLHPTSSHFCHSLSIQKTCKAFGSELQCKSVPFSRLSFLTAKASWSFFRTVNEKWIFQLKSFLLLFCHGLDYVRTFFARYVFWILNFCSISLKSFLQLKNAA